MSSRWPEFEMSKPFFKMTLRLTAVQRSKRILKNLGKAEPSPTTIRQLSLKHFYKLLIFDQGTEHNDLQQYAKLVRSVL